MAGTAVPGGESQKSEGWSSRTAFVLAAVGAAVGLGNLWRFPTLAGENGGAAFVLVYIACVIFIGLPLVLSEVLVGRAGRKDAVGSVKVVAEKSGVSSRWAALGWIELLAAFLIMTTYSVIAGWVIYYAYTFGADLLSNIFAGNFLSGAFAGDTTDQVQGRDARPVWAARFDDSAPCVVHDRNHRRCYARRSSRYRKSGDDIDAGIFCVAGVDHYLFRG